MKLILTLVLANLFAWPVVSLPAKAIPTYTTEWSNSSSTRIEPVPLEISSSTLEYSSLATTTTSPALTSSDLQPCTNTIHQTYADDGIMQKVSTADESGSCLYTAYIASSAGPTIESLVSFIAAPTATVSPYSSSMVGPVRDSSAVVTTAVLNTSSPSTFSENTKSLLASLSSLTTSSNTFATTTGPISSVAALNTSCTATVSGQDVGNSSMSYTTYSGDDHCAYTVAEAASGEVQTPEANGLLNDPSTTSQASHSSTDSTTTLQSTSFLTATITLPKSTGEATSGSYTGVTASQSTDSVMATVGAPLTNPVPTATGATDTKSVNGHVTNLIPPSQGTETALRNTIPTSTSTTASSSSTYNYLTDCASPPCTGVEVSPIQQTPASYLIGSSTFTTSASLHKDPASANGAKTLEVPSTTSTTSPSASSMVDAASGSETSTTILPIITTPTTTSSIVMTVNGSLTTVADLLGGGTPTIRFTLVNAYGTLTVNGAPVVEPTEGALIETSSTSSISSTTESGLGVTATSLPTTRSSSTENTAPADAAAGSFTVITTTISAGLDRGAGVPVDSQKQETVLVETVPVSTSTAFNVETTSSVNNIGTELAVPVPGLIATRTSGTQPPLTMTEQETAPNLTEPTTGTTVSTSPTVTTTGSDTPLSATLDEQKTAPNLIEPTTITLASKESVFVPITTTLKTSTTSPIVISLGSTPITVEPIIASDNIAPSPVISLGDTSVTANSASQFVVSSQTLTPGGAITVSGSQGTTTISLASAATAAVINGETQPLSTPVVTSQVKQSSATSPTVSAIVDDSLTVTENSASEFVIGSQILKSDSPITVTNSQGTTTFSLAPSNTAVVINGATSPIAPVETGSSPTPAVVTIGSSTYTQNSASAFVVGSQTISQGADITVSGTTVSLASAATAIVVNGVTSAISTPTAESLQQSAKQKTPQEITIGSSVITAISASDAFVVGSQTLVPGAQITVSGTTISLASSASAIVVNGATSSIAVAAQGAVNNNADTHPQAASEYLVAGQTLAPGSAITVQGSTLSLAASGTGIVINGFTPAFPTPSITAIAPLQEITIGSSVVTENSASNFVIASQTLAPGAQITVSGTTISLAQSATAVVVNGVTSNLPIPETTSLPEITLGSSVLTANSASEFVFASQTLSPGSQITVSGTTLSLAPSASAIVINGQISQIATETEAPTAPEVTLGSSVLTANTASEFIIASQTLSPGSQITVSGTTISLAPSASAIVINGQTSQIATETEEAPSAHIAPEITVGSSIITANTASEFIIASQTLSPGSAITVSGTTLSLAPSITAVVINGKTTPISAAPMSTPKIILGNSTFIENPTSAFVIAGQTLTPGETITASSTTIALLPSGNGVVINGVTSTFATAPAVTPAPEVLTVGSQVFTATSGVFVLDGQTLSNGGAVIVSGTVVSLGPSGAVIGVISTLSTEVFGQTGSVSQTPTNGPSYTDSLATATATGKKGGASGRSYNILVVWIGVIFGGLILF